MVKMVPRGFTATADAYLTPHIMRSASTPPHISMLMQNPMHMIALMLVTQLSWSCNLVQSRSSKLRWLLRQIMLCQVHSRLPRRL